MYGTVSYKLALDVVHLAQSLGALAVITEEFRVDRPNERTFYRVGIKVPRDMPVPFRLQRYVDAWKPRKSKELVRSIVSAERVERAEAICRYRSRTIHPLDRS